MTKKNVTSEISDEEFNSMIGMDYQHTKTGNYTEASILTDDGERKIIPEPTEGRRNEVASAVNAARAASVPIEPINPAIPSASTAITAPVASALSSAPSTPVAPDRQSDMTAPTPPDPLRRPSAKQRKVSFDEYREVFLRAPKITDRQPVFLSRETRDRLDEIVRKLGERKMGVSGFLENLARHHLENYAEDVEVWKRL